MRSRPRELTLAIFAAAISGAIASTSAAQPPTGTTKAPGVPIGALVVRPPTAPPQICARQSVAGLDSISARRRLLCLDVGVTYRDTLVVDPPFDVVARQWPTVGTPHLPNEIDTLVMRRRAPLVRVPPVVGRDSAAARQILAQFGFPIARIALEWDASMSIGKVARQRPDANARVPRGTPESLTVSLGAKPQARKKRPDVFDSTFDVAERILLDSGAARVEFAQKPAKGDRVERQSPTAGLPMRAGEVDTLFLRHVTKAGSTSGSTRVPPWVWIAGALLALAAALHLTGTLGPRFRVTVQSDPPALSTPPNTSTVAHDLTVKTVVGDVTSDLRTPTERIILREERRHDAS